MISTTKLSSKGQVIIPKPFRLEHHWDAGQELIVIDAGDGILLKPKTPFPESDIKEAASCLQYNAEAKTIDNFESAIAEGIKEKYR